jgi:hypothetical protein
MNSDQILNQVLEMTLILNIQGHALCESIQSKL